MNPSRSLHHAHIPTEISTCLTSTPDSTPDGEWASNEHHDILARLAAVDSLGDSLCSCDLGAPAAPPIPPVT